MATNHGKRISHFDITLNLVLKASLSYKNEISYVGTSNLFSYEWFCAWPRFDREDSRKMI